ncbi:hypothetical protein FSPOR_671 [Fusarium sporotrichioides]|uniref:Erythromycin esterase n=1 Tax=Fusarium sporotrichioides TaxID=5514 RepID=A0A395SSZ3_FUSSP|nr:hypothetical protein FSPOR_671 [Fusarium sporotrichioides]
MSPPRRRSARLASSTKTKPVAPTLEAVTEDAESPQRLPEPKAKNKSKSKNKTNAVPSSPAPAPSTPASSAMKPPHDEMHPSKAHQTMGEPSSAMRLGFTDIKDNNEPDTPSKIGVPASDFTFRVTRDTTDTSLSGDAQRMMVELRQQAAKIKADLIAQRDADASDVDGRKIAKPTGKTNRYSAAHMAEFKKMDSIENHPSAWRAQNGRFQPVVQSLKRTPSKANLETTPTSSSKSGLKRSPSKAELDVPTPSTPRVTQSLKRKSSRANLEEYQQSPSPKKATMPPSGIPMALPPSAKKPQLLPNAHERERVTSKRFKQREDDDASTNRPVSRDDSSIPRPKSSGNGSTKLPASKPNFSRLLSPTKASLAHSGKPTISLIKSPSKVDLKSGLSKSTSTPGLLAPSEAATPRARVLSSGRLDRVKSILRGHRTPSGNVQTAIPQPKTSQTPAPPRADKDKALPPVPLTTPRRKVTKHVAFTPEVTRIAFQQNSPSPLKSCLKAQPTRNLEDEKFQGIDQALAKADSGDVVYPDLSGFRPLPELPAKEKDALPIAPASVPGKFTFRSDHTIEFGDAPVLGFGASPGQSSVRQVRQSLKPDAKMPGSFPGPTSPISPNKENKLPGSEKVIFGAPHGMSNKKRHRTSWDEEEAEEKQAERSNKKRKAEHVPEGEALLAPRLVGGTPSAKKARTGAITRTPATASPIKKRSVLSMSRLNMLARPKNRA